MLLTFLKGTHGKNPNEHFDATTATLATHAIARLHRMSSYADPSLLGNHAVLNTHYCWREFEQRHALLVPKQAGRWVRQQLDIISLPTDLPQGICHADLNYGNFLFKDNHLTGMIDFDMSFWGPFVYDIASLIYWWAWPPHSPLNEDAARLIVREYESIRPLSEIERTHILDALALILLLSISWSDEQDFEKERIRFESLPKNLNF